MRVDEVCPVFDCKMLTRGGSFFSWHLFADVISMHNRIMKHACAIEFKYTNLLIRL